MSHFSCAPLFQVPLFFKKQMLVSNILYNVLLIDILFGEIKKKWNHTYESFCFVKADFDINTRDICICNFIGIISNKCCDRKSTNQFFIQI